VGRIRNKVLKFLSTVSAATVLSASASTAPFDLIRIGDVDGFSWASSTGGPGTGWLVCSGGDAIAPATNGNGIIEQTEFLPDMAAPPH